MKFAIVDIETNGLLDIVNRMHCLCYQIVENGVSIEKGTILEPEEIVKLLERVDYFVIHNGYRYDRKALIKIFGIDIPKNKLIDTLTLSWYLFPNRKLHGLGAWAEDVGLEKPPIDDWEGLTQEEYIHRCTEDVEINTRLFIGMWDYLIAIYNGMEGALNIASYLGFKADCLADQEEIGITADVDLILKHQEDLLTIFDENTERLSRLMPEELGKVVKTKPKVFTKKDGSLSANALKWMEYLKENNLDPLIEEVRELPNPGSDVQLKKWLFSLGWEPVTFKISKSTGEKIPQVNLPFGQGLCQSVKDLYEEEPNLEVLEMYYKIKHRLGIFKSYLECVDEDNMLYATAHGFTNTIRLTHSKPIVNLPKPGVYFGKEVREVLTVPNKEEYIMIGSDVSGLEDNTKQHYIYFYDPDYVTEMRVPGFDPHVDIGKLAGLITKEEEDLFKRVEAGKKEDFTEEELVLYKSIKKRRGVAKQANFAATYGAGGPKIAETAKIPLEDGEQLHKIYWQRNWAVKKIAQNCLVKEVNGQKWLYNPLSGFWLFLKNDKDRFSTLNQNTGVFVFDNWMYEVRKGLEILGIKVCLQYHDELLIWCKKEYQEQVEEILKSSMRKVNELLNLNVEINVSIDIGYNYAECH